MLTCAALAQTPDLKSASGYPKMVEKQVTGWIERAAEKMPQEEYAFKPDPAVRSFGQILGHIADADYLFCSAVSGRNQPLVGDREDQDNESGTNVPLHDAFAYCNLAYDTLTDLDANATVKAFGGERNKLGVIWSNALHNMEHYRSRRTRPLRRPGADAGERTAHRAAPATGGELCGDLRG